MVETQVEEEKDDAGEVYFRILDDNDPSTNFICSHASMTLMLI